MLVHLTWDLCIASLSVPVEHFICLVRTLYNLQYTQALAALSAKFSPEERQAWSTSGALKKVMDISPTLLTVLPPCTLTSKLRKVPSIEKPVHAVSLYFLPVIPRNCLQP